MEWVEYISQFEFSYHWKNQDEQKYSEMRCDNQR